MAAKRLHLEIITQEKKLFSDDVDLILAPSYQGQIGLLPGHVNLLTTLGAGELFVLRGPSFTAYAVSGGFLDVHDDQVTIMADSATRADQISLNKAEQAKRQAEEALKQKLSTKEFSLVQADLRKAVLELKVGKKRRHYRPLKA